MNDDDWRERTQAAAARQRQVEREKIDKAWAARQRQCAHYLDIALGLTFDMPPGIDKAPIIAALIQVLDRDYSV